ncbi:hypothetical protein PMAYCL1PPCAC_03498, partial [Pristionchus mayeri]
KFGAIEKMDVSKDMYHTHGSALITFDDYDSVDQCVMMRSHKINGHRCSVTKGFVTAYEAEQHVGFGGPIPRGEGRRSAGQAAAATRAPSVAEMQQRTGVAFDPKFSLRRRSCPY